MLGLSFWNRVTHLEILKQSESVSIEGNLSRWQLRWVSYLIRMLNKTLPTQFLYVLTMARCCSAGLFLVFLLPRFSLV